jgi:hypothetical protein
MAKKAFKRPWISTLPRCPEPNFFAASWQWKINHSRSDRAASNPRVCIAVGPTRRCIASRWLTRMLASDLVAFMVQRFRKMT